METPLFGEESPRDKAVQYIVGGLLALGVVLSLIFAFINASDRPVNIVLAMSLCALLAILIVLWRWYRVGDLDPKFKYLIGGIIFTLLLLIITSNIYFWEQSVKDYCAADQSFYDIATGKCYKTCAQDFCLDVTVNTCVYNCSGRVPPSTAAPTDGSTRAPGL